MKLIKSKVEILDKLNGDEIINRIATVARTCYKSEVMSTTESDKALVKRLVDSKHHAMIEFADITVKFTCCRAIAQEITRHRLMSFSMESQRYCTYNKDRFGNEITYIIPSRFDWNEANNIDERSVLMSGSGSEDDIEFLLSLARAENTYKYLLANGWKAQEARDVLPNATKTEINCKANLREWLHFLTLRCSTAAHPDIRVLALDLLKQLHEQIPVIFDNLYDEYYGK